MFIVLLRYTRPLDEIDRHMPEHVAYLRQCYAASVFVASGRREPRDGGVILARGVTREQLEGILDLDPFVVAGVATYEVIEFRTSQHDPALPAVRRPGHAPHGIASAVVPFARQTTGVAANDPSFPT